MEPPPGRVYKKGMFKFQTPWSKDTSTAYFEGAHMRVYWPIAKLILLCLEYFLVVSIGLQPVLGALCCLLTLLFYQDVVAYFKGYTRMKSLDVQCLLGSGPAQVNAFSVQCFDKRPDKESLIQSYN